MTIPTMITVTLDKERVAINTWKIVQIREVNDKVFIFLDDGTRIQPEETWDQLEQTYEFLLKKAMK